MAFFFSNPLWRWIEATLGHCHCFNIFGWDCVKIYFNSLYKYFLSLWCCECIRNQSVKYTTWLRFLTYFTWPGESQEWQKDIIAVTLMWDNELNMLEVLALNEKWVPQTSGTLFLNITHQTMQHLKTRVYVNVTLYQSEVLIYVWSKTYNTFLHFHDTEHFPCITL